MFAVIFAFLVAGACQAIAWGSLEKGSDLCEAVIKETILNDRATSVDDTPSRLHSIWLSQDCEVRTGPEYVIRKYTFFENGTFLLLRYHYAEESCSVATHTVMARGSIKLLSSSVLTLGATEAKFQLDVVHIIPLNRQVAHKFGHRLNVTCGAQPRWRPYVPQPIYERPSHRFANPLWYGPRYNSHQGHSSISSQQGGMDCLEPLGIEFGELRLLRVQRRPTPSKSFDSFESISIRRSRVELLLGGLPSNIRQRFAHKPTSLQPAALLRSDTTNDCPVCASVSRSTEFSPPLLHEVAALPALLGGTWLSTGCESIRGGLWSKRQLRIYSGDKLWTARWDYYTDPRCTSYFYANIVAGSYVQRAGRQRRHGESQIRFEAFDEDSPVANVFAPGRFYGKEDRVEFSDTSDRFRSVNLEVQNHLDEENTEQQTIHPEKENNPVLSNENYRHRPNELRQRPANLVPSNSSILLPRLIRTKKVHVGGNHDARRSRRNLDDNIYRHLLRGTRPSMAESFTAMLRGNQNHREEPTRKPLFNSFAPSGTTELDLHVAESLLTPGDLGMALRCGGKRKDETLDFWPRSCVPRGVEAPSTLTFRAKVGVSWSGQYTLLLGQRDENLWEAPLRQCGRTISHDPNLRAHLRKSLGLRYGLFTSFGVADDVSASAGANTTPQSVAVTFARQLVFLCLFYSLR